MKSQPLYIKLLAIALLSLGSSASKANAVVADHAYEFNGTLADSFGGPSMVAAGGTLGTTSYRFGVGQGPNVSGVLTNTGHYSIEVEFRVADVSGYRSVISFNNLTQDNAFYITNGSIRLYNYVEASQVCISNNTTHRLVITRDGATKQFKGFVDGIERLSVTDTNNIAVAASVGGILHFFRDNGGENATGSIDLIRTYNRVLTPAEIQTLTSPTGNDQPSISVNNASLSVDEGSISSNSGSFSDPQGNGTVSLTTSLGTLTQNNAAGTWSWSHTPTDGPLGPVTVTITATDNATPPLLATTSFTLTVNNVAPAYDLGALISLDAGLATLNTQISFTDPGADTWTGTVNYGDGSGSYALTVAGPAKSFTLSHSFPVGGRYTISTTLTDDDAGSQSDTVQIDVLRSPHSVTSPANNIRAYSATLHGTVNPNHSQHRGSTSAWFEYSTDPNVAVNILSTVPQSISVSGDVPTAASLTAVVLRLKADTDYYFRAVAQNEAGISHGNILSFHSSYPAASDVSFDASMGLNGGGEIYRPIPGVINAAGRITFKSMGTVGSGAITSANDAMLLSDVSGSLRVIGQEGTAAPGGGTLSGSFNHLVMTEAGRSVTSELFRAATTANDNGYLIADDGISLAILSREADTLATGGTFIGHTGRPVVDDQERVYFPGALSGVMATKNSGLWYDSEGSLQTFVIEGADVSALTGSPAWLGNISAILSAAGSGAAFITALQNNPDNSSQKTASASNAAIFSGAPGSLEMVARKGDVIPAVGKLSTFSAVSRGSNGDHAFISLLSLSSAAPVVSSTNDQVLFAKVAGSLYLVARENTTELAVGLKTQRFGPFYMTGNGEIIFQCWGSGNGVTTANDGHLCRWTVLGGLQVLAREGSTATGTGANFTAFQSLSVSPGGAVVLQSTLSNGRITLMRAMPGNSLAPVVQTTQSVLLNGVSRSILSLGIHGTGTGSGGGGSGLGAAINDAGAVFTVLSVGSGDYVSRIYRP